MTRKLLLPALGLALVAVSTLAAGCGGDDDTSEPTATASSTGSATSSASATSTASTATGTATGATVTATGATGTATGTATATATPDELIPFELPGFSFEKDAPGGTGVVSVKEIRAARNATFDRIVFEFEGDKIPGYKIGYVTDVEACGSGERVNVIGEAKVAIVLMPAQAHTDAGEPTVPVQVPLEGMTVVRELRSYCDFEADVSYVAGLSGARPYRVFELQSPARLVIDFGQ